MKNFVINWRTTLIGVLAIAFTALKYFAPQVMTTETFVSIVSILGGCGFVVAKDGTVTGIGASATTVEQAALPVAIDLLNNTTNPALVELKTLLQQVLAGQNQVAQNKPQQAAGQGTTPTQPIS